jgi:hypothetical protein
MKKNQKNKKKRKLTSQRGRDPAIDSFRILPKDEAKSRWNKSKKKLLNVILL